MAMAMMNLPDELLSMICEKISSVIDLVNLSVCSKRLNFICKDLTYMNNVYEITKINSIKYALEFNENIKLKINLSESNLKDVPNILGNVHTLNLGCCKEISDVSMLGNVYDLNLTCCDGITDVSKLGKVHTLNLVACDKVTDVSMLGNVYDLNLSSCKNVTDVSMLGRVNTLDISNCINVTDISMICDIENLYIS
jgi:hypothetical protein